MDAYTLFRNDILKQGEIIGESKGEKRGIKIGLKRGIQQGIDESVINLAEFFLNEKDNNLTKEKALQKAKEILESKTKKD